MPILQNFYPTVDVFHHALQCAYSTISFLVYLWPSFTLSKQSFFIFVDDLFKRNFFTRDLNYVSEVSSQVSSSQMGKAAVLNIKVKTINFKLVKRVKALGGGFRSR